MLKFNDLTRLSYGELESKVIEASGILVPKLVDRGIVKANGSIEFKSSSMNCLDLSISVLNGVFLNSNCEGCTNTEYVISLTEKGFNTVSIYDDGNVMCTEYNIESICEDKVVYNGDSIMLSDIIA